MKRREANRKVVRGSTVSAPPSEVLVMRNPRAHLLRWTPRILGFVFAAFISVFALDAIGEGKTLARNILDLAAHLIPTAIILGTLAISWRWSWAGGLMFLALGGCYVAMAWPRFPWMTYVVIAGPLFLLGILFEIDWWNRSTQERNCWNELKTRVCRK